MLVYWAIEATAAYISICCFWFYNNAVMCVTMVITLATTELLMLPNLLPCLA
jgi:hypothetical protein